MPEGHDPDLDLRIVRYFTVVAELGHFGHAAEALYLTQPTLSRYVRRLERRLEVRLLDRTSRGVRVTEAGRTFLAAATELLEAAGRAVASARDVAARHRVRIGHGTTVLITPAVRELRRRHPEAEIRTVHLRWNEPRPALLEHRVDTVVARMPFRTDHLDVVVLRQDPRVLRVAADHRLAGRGSVDLADFADEPVPVFPDPEWSAFWRVDPRPDGGSAPVGPAVDSIEDFDEAIAGGAAVGIAPSDRSGTTGRRPDLVEIPIRDVAPSSVVVASRPDEDNELVAEFHSIARERLGAIPPVHGAVPNTLSTTAKIESTMDG